VVELLRFCVGLGTAAVAVLYYELTRKIEPSLTGGQRQLALVALFGMVFAILSALGAWAFDSLFYSAWAQELQAGSENERGHWRRRRDRHSSGRRWCLLFATGLFAGSMIVLAAYALDRS
jgi:hypothetical protein